MKIFNKFDFPPKTKNKEQKDKNNLDEQAANTGDPELALNKEIFSVLSDPEFIKTFPGPADFQYDSLRESLVSSLDNAKNGMAYLKKYIQTNDSPLFCLVRFGQFLHIAVGNQKNFIKKMKNRREYLLY